MTPQTLIAEIDILCNEVSRGITPVARMTCPEEKIEVAVRFIGYYNLKTYVSDVKADVNQLKYIWIYRYNHLYDIIVKLAPVAYTTMDTFEIWSLGKLLGWSEKAIEDYLSEMEEE